MASPLVPLPRDRRGPSLRDGFRDMTRLAFTARCARRRPASLMPAVTNRQIAVASLRATVRWTSGAQASDGNHARKRTGHAAADSPLRAGSPGCPTDWGCRTDDPRRRALRQHPRWRAGLPPEPSADRDRRLATASFRRSRSDSSAYPSTSANPPKGITSTALTSEIDRRRREAENSACRT
jgi:hypothetical protein